MARLQWLLAGTICGACLVALLAAPAAAGVSVGPFGDSYGDELVFSYDAASPTVTSGSPGSGIGVEYDPDASPLLKVFQISGSRYHHLHIVEHWVVEGTETVYDWNETLMVSDGLGGWTPSGNDDDLWFSAKASVTPMPETDPAATTIVLTNRPLDRLAIQWTAGLPVGTQFTVDKWITVPEGMTTFGVYQSQELTTGVPEPATMSLLGLGLGILLVRRVRRRQAPAQ